MFSKVDRYKSQIDTLRPFEGNNLKQIKDYYKIGLTYSSNALEGNSLTETETKILLEDGLTVGGKPIRDYYEATGHAKAYDYIYSLAQGESISENEYIVLLEKAHKDDKPFIQFIAERVEKTQKDLIRLLM